MHQGAVQVATGDLGLGEPLQHLEELAAQPILVGEQPVVVHPRQEVAAVQLHGGGNVVGGDRGPSQLVRWTSERVYEDLQRRAALLNQTTPSDRRVRRLRSQVRSVHVFLPSPEIAEISVHVRYGQRSRCLAARLERRTDRWVATALELG